MSKGSCKLMKRKEELKDCPIGQHVRLIFHNNRETWIGIFKGLIGDDEIALETKISKKIVMLPYSKLHYWTEETNKKESDKSVVEQLLGEALDFAHDEKMRIAELEKQLKINAEKARLFDAIVGGCNFTTILELMKSLNISNFCDFFNILKENGIFTDELRPCKEHEKCFRVIDTSYRDEIGFIKTSTLIMIFPEGVELIKNLFTKT